MRGIEQGGNNSSETGKKLLGLTVPEDVPITGIAAFAAILGAVAVYEYKKHKDKSSQAPGTESPKTKKNKRR